MKFQFKNEGDIDIIEVFGNVMGGPDFEPFHNEIKSKLKQGRRKFLFDLCKVKWINSTGVGLPLKTQTSFRVIAEIFRQELESDFPAKM